MRTIMAMALLAGLSVLGSTFARAAATDGSDGVRTLGLGLNWAREELGVTDGDNPGGVTARYWFNERWGVDAAVGTGFPVVSHNSIYMINFSAEGMRALKRFGDSVLYADLLALPELAHVNGGQVGNVYVDNGQHGTAFAVSVSAGLGFESALHDFSGVRWFVQLNPLSYAHVSPAPGSLVKGSQAVDLLGSNMVMMLGFHFHF